VKHSRRSSRVLSSLSDSVHLRLNMYALAASAAGVGALAPARPSEAEIVYTPAQVTIGINKTIPLDLNHDGENRFPPAKRLGRRRHRRGGLERPPRPTVEPGRGFGTSLFRRPYAYALMARTRVGPSAQFDFGKYIYVLDANATQVCHGFWNDVKNRYLGLRFNIKQKTHYGWARLNISWNPLQPKEPQDHSSAHWLRLRDHPEQAHRYRQDKRAG
jgi:hypothetical protein